MSTIQKGLLKLQDDRHRAVYWITLLSTQQSENIFHLFSYCTCMDGALALRIVPLTNSLHSLRRRSDTAEAKPTGAGSRGQGTRSDLPAVRGDLSCRGGATASCNRACAAEETTFFPAKRGPPGEACGPVGEPSVALVGSEVEGEWHKATPVASNALGHPVQEGWTQNQNQNQNLFIVIVQQYNEIKS